MENIETLEEANRRKDVKLVELEKEKETIFHQLTKLKEEKAQILNVKAELSNKLEECSTKVDQMMSTNRELSGELN